MKLVLPKNEKERLETLASYRIMDTPPDSDFDDLVRIAASVFEVPIALISLVEADRQWFKARVGLEATQTPRDQSFCAHAIVNNRTLIVKDATLDERFSNNPLVLREPSIRFYAGAPLRAPDGHGLGTLCVIDTKPHPEGFDVRKLDVIEALSRQAALLLELRRTEFELTHAMTKVEQAEQQRYETLAFLSHDLRSPMTSLLALTQRYRQAPEQLLVSEVFDSIEKYARHNLEAADEFLQLARAKGTDEIDMFDFELGMVVQNATDLMYEQAKEKRVRFEVSWDGFDQKHGIWSHGNADLIERAVTNLLINSVKYGPSDAAVEVRIARTDTHDRVEIRDYGPGVPDNERDLIFEPYYRARSHSRGRVVGSGLGLALVKAVAERHGGHIEVDSPPGGGAYFAMLLPRSPGKLTLV